MAVQHLRTGGPKRPGSGPGRAPLGPIFLVDTSALAKAQFPGTAQEALATLNMIGRLATCLPLMLESGYSARNFQDRQDAMQKLFGPFDKLAPVPELLEIAVDLQGRLFKAGIGRSVGVADLIVAAHALHYRGEGAAVTIVHYDADYDRLARVAPELCTQWLVPRGSL